MGKSSSWSGPAADAGRKTFQEFMTTNGNPYGQGTLDRVAWWSTFIEEAQKARNNAKEQWLIRLSKYAKRGILMKGYLLPLLLLSGCVSSWPQGSYNDLAFAADDTAIKTALVDCIVELVPPNSSVHLIDSTNGSLPVMLTMMLSDHHIQARDDNAPPVSYIIATTGTASNNRQSEGAFIRVIAPKGICSQYFTRDSNRELRAAGPVMIALQANT